MFPLVQGLCHLLHCLPNSYAPNSALGALGSKADVLCRCLVYHSVGIQISDDIIPPPNMALACIAYSSYHNDTATTRLRFNCDPAMYLMPIDERNFRGILNECMNVVLSLCN